MKHSEANSGVILWVVITLLMIKFPFVRVIAGLIVLPQVAIMIWNCFSVNLLGRGSFHKKVSVSNRQELPVLFNKVVRDDLIKGQVEVSQTRILACGCEEPIYGVKKLTPAEAQAHMQKLVSDFDLFDSSLDASNTVYFTFKTGHGRCIVSYRMIGPKSLELERKNMVTFPVSAKYNTSNEDNSLAVTYSGKSSEYSQLATAWGL